MDQTSSTTGTRITQHAWNRMNARRLSNEAINAALTYGRVVHVRGAAIHVIGRKEVERLSRAGLDLEAYEGVQVVCTPDDAAVLTAYRNRDFRGLKARGGRKWH